MMITPASAASEREDAAREIREAREAVDQAQRRLKQAKERLARINRLAPAPMSPAPAVPQEQPKPKVSDHAVIRFLERRYRFDFEGVRREILTPARAAAIRAGARSIKHDGIRFVVADMVIVTAVEHGK